MEGEGGEETRPCGRYWAMFQRGPILILLKVGLMRCLEPMDRCVGQDGGSAKEEPDRRRRIDMTNHCYGCDAFLLTDPALLAIDWSGGQLEESSVVCFGDDDLLEYLCLHFCFHFLYFVLNSDSARE
jgi:hypothetical protein